MGRPAVIVMAGALALAVVACGDIVRLKDGAALRGDAVRSDKGWQVRLADGTVRSLREDEVAGIELQAPATRAAAAEGQLLANFRSGIEKLSDTREIIRRYEVFIRQNSDSAIGAEARKDLALWQQRQAQGAVKIGGQWLGRDEVQALDQKSIPAIEEARDLIREGRSKEALALLDKLLAEAPTSAGGLYLKGLILAEQGQVGPARKAFETAAVHAPTHGPTLNNAAALQWRQRAYLGALTNFDKAMSALPLTPRIHDNVAEALLAAPREVRNSAALRKLTGHFEAAEPRLQKEMAKTGWYRWGATWVGAQEIQEIRRVEKEVNTRLTELAKQHASLQKDLREVNEQIAACERQIGNIELQRRVQAGNGGTLPPYPDAWIGLRQRQAELEGQRREIQRRLEDYPRQVAEVKAELPQPAFSGVPKLMDEQFAPMPASKASPPETSSPAPTTLPSASTTQPTPVSEPPVSEVPTTQPQ